MNSRLSSFDSFIRKLCNALYRTLTSGLTQRVRYLLMWRIYRAHPEILRIRDVYPGSRIRIVSIPDPLQRIQVFQPIKLFFMLSEIWSGLFIPDPDPDFLPIPDPGSRGKKAPDPGYGSATLATGICDVLWVILCASFRRFPCLPLAERSGMSRRF